MNEMASSAGFVNLSRIGYLVSTAVVVIAFVGSGVANLTRAEHIASDMHRLGYPDYFMTILGAWKVLGAIAVASPRLPRLKEWAYAGMIFDLTGGSASRAIIGDPLHTVIVPLVIACLVFVSWALRPARSRFVPATGECRTS
ncbi:MAG TPA: DoxX family protein [Polyangiaceae bacterium]|nr:DoxX family protein [Polyangiaceae bacterium]